jgi:hypothetical protein
MWMKLFKISQTERRDYDTYDSAVVCAEDAESAKRIYPGYIPHGTDREAETEKYWKGEAGSDYNDWASSPDNVSVEEIGTALPHMQKGVIVASFNAG